VAPRSANRAAPQTDGAAGSTVLLEVASPQACGFTVDEVMDMLAVGPATLEDRSGGGLAGVDPTLVRAVGRAATTCSWCWTSPPCWAPC